MVRTQGADLDSALPASGEGERSSAPGTERTLAILELLSRSGDAGMTISEIARALELPNNSTSRVVETIQEFGYIERLSEGRRYVLTRKLLDIARPIVRDRSLAATAFELLCNLRDQTGETAQLIVRSQNRSVVIEQVASRQPVKVLGEIGFRVPMFSCAPGKAILAALPLAELEEYLSAVRLKQYTPTTHGTRESLLRELQRIRHCGYGVDLAEGVAGIHCVGAAILDTNGYPIAGLTVIGPSFRLREEHFEAVGAQCRACAAAIGRRLHP
jgi:DNA-binding IclR family transcriptional regulator